MRLLITDLTEMHGGNVRVAGRDMQRRRPAQQIDIDVLKDGLLAGGGFRPGEPLKRPFTKGWLERAPGGLAALEGGRA